MKNETTFRLEDMKVKRMTEKALLVEVRNEAGKPVEHWLPRSQVKETDCLGVNDEGYAILTEWIAKEKGFLKDED
jgi:hypothetical protein